MSTAIWGTVVEGKVIPESMLPEGARVQIVIPAGQQLQSTLAMTPDLQAELDSWVLGSTQAIELIEQIPKEDIQ